MTVAQAPPVQDESPADGRPRRGRGARRVLIVSVGLAVVLAAGVGFDRHRNGATAFFPYPGIGMVQDATVGEPVHIGMVFPEGDRSVEVESVEVVVGEGSTPAATTAWVCERRHGAPGIGSSIGDPGEFCSTVGPAQDTLITSAGATPYDQHYLVVTVAALAPGEVHLEGVHVNFRDGWRRGSEHTGLGATIRVRG